MFVATFFTVAKILKQPKFLAMDKENRNIYYSLYTLFSLKKERNATIWDNIDKPGEY